MSKKNPEISNFGKDLKKLRKRQGVPLRIVAAAIDLDPSTLGKFEKNTRKPSREIVKKLSTYFSVSFDTLYVQAASDRIVDDLACEKLRYKILQEAENKLKQKR